RDRGAHEPLAEAARPERALEAEAEHRAMHLGGEPASAQIDVRDRPLAAARIVVGNPREPRTLPARRVDPERRRPLDARAHVVAIDRGARGAVRRAALAGLGHLPREVADERADLRSPERADGRAGGG